MLPEARRCSWWGVRPGTAWLLASRCGPRQSALAEVQHLFRLAQGTPLAGLLSATEHSSWLAGLRHGARHAVERSLLPLGFRCPLRPGADGGRANARAYGPAPILC